MSALFDITVAQAIARIEVRDALLRAFVSTRLPDARREADDRARQAPRSPLHAVPFSLKDEWETRCLPTTGGSWRFRERRPSVDATVLRAFQDAGAVLVGKTNLSDMGLAPESSSWVGGDTRNPHDLTRTAGGSSGGAAAAVADRMVGFDWGTDIGGSIRLPSAYCGVYGMRLSSQTWPVTELFPTAPPSMAWLLGQGPITRTLAEMRAVLAAAAPAVRAGTDRGPFRPRGAVLYTVERGGHWPAFAADVAAPLAAAGLELRAASLTSTARARWIASGVWCSHLDDLIDADADFTLWSGAAAVLSAVLLRGRLGDRRFHPVTAEILLQVLVGRAFLFRDKRRALAAARAYRDEVERIWDAGGVVVMPVCAWPAPRIGQSNRNPRILECTMPGNLVDATALAVPWGRFPDGLPRALQLLGPPGSELALIELAERLRPAGEL
jgi:Asp-tRNA(Asn)/Glu-tRNA(Gln) amidotransferase A subunit family amidase